MGNVMIHASRLSAPACDVPGAAFVEGCHSRWEGGGTLSQSGRVAHNGYLCEWCGC